LFGSRFRVQFIVVHTAPAGNGRGDLDPTFNAPDGRVLVTARSTGEETSVAIQEDQNMVAVGGVGGAAAQILTMRIIGVPTGI
jgi:hypothetical protein